jgi:hypothetical protein
MKSSWTFVNYIQNSWVDKNVIAGQAAVPLQIAPNRYSTIYALIDTRGHDSCCGIVGQLRENTPNGKILQHFEIAKGGNECKFFPDEESLYYRCVGQPQVFGSQKLNCWVVKYYIYAHQFIDGVLHNSFSKQWPGRLHAACDSLRLYTVQLSYDSNLDAIKIVQPETKVITNDSIFDLCSANHALTPPAALDKDHTQFVELVTFTPRGQGLHNTGSHGKVAPVQWSFDLDSNLYKVTKVGQWWDIDDCIGEASVVKTPEGDFVASLRSFGHSGEIVLTKTSDLFSGFGKLVCHKGTCTPRTLYCSSDGKLHLFTNIDWISPYNHERNPLYEFILDDNLNLTQRETVFDAISLPFNTPFADMAKYCEITPHHEMLLCRVIDLSQTAGNMNFPPISNEAVNASGIYVFERKK